MKLDRARIRVDFNELIEEDLVLLSKTDDREDSEGNIIKLEEGVPVCIYEFNHYSDGTEEYLLAEGVVELNLSQVNAIAKWCCRINENGIQTKIT